MTNRRVPIVAGLLLTLGGAVVHLTAGQSQSTDEQQILKLLAAHAHASVIGDLRGLVDVYHEDADIRYSNGTAARGKTAIESRYQQSLGRDSKASAHGHPPETVKIRFLRPDVAFVDVESVSGDGTASDGTRPPVSRTPLFVVFTKEKGRWGVAVQRSGVDLK